MQSFLPFRRGDFDLFDQNLRYQLQGGMWTDSVTQDHSVWNQELISQTYALTGF